MAHYTQKARRDSERALHELIKEQCAMDGDSQSGGPVIEFRKLAALASFRFGYTESKTMEYLVDLSGLGLVKVDEENNTVALRN